MEAPSMFRRCATDPSRVPMTSHSHTQLLLDLPDLFIYFTVWGDGK